MAIRDLLQAQVQQMGKALGKVLVEVLDFKSSGKLNEGIEQCNEELSTLLSIDISDLLGLSIEELRTFANVRKLTDEHLEILARYLTELGNHQQTTKSDAQPSYRKAIELLDLANEISQTFSLERLETKNKLSLLLNKGDNDSTLSA